MNDTFYVRIPSIGTVTNIPIHVVDNANQPLPMIPKTSKFVVWLNTKKSVLYILFKDDDAAAIFRNISPDYSLEKTKNSRHQLVILKDIYPDRFGDYECLQRVVFDLLKV